MPPPNCCVKLLNFFGVQENNEFSLLTLRIKDKTKAAKFEKIKLLKVWHNYKILVII
jgi:hypothetical protein